MKMTASFFMIFILISVISFSEEQEESAAVPFMVFRSAFEDIYMIDPENGQPLFGYSLGSKGFARIDYKGRLATLHGSFIAPKAGALLRQPDEGEAIHILISGVSGTRTGRIIGIGQDFQVLRNKQSLELRINGESLTCANDNVTDEPFDIRIVLGHTQVSFVIVGKPLFRKLLNKWPAINRQNLVFGSGTISVPGWDGRIESFSIYKSNVENVQTTPGFAQPYLNTYTSGNVLTVRCELLKKSTVATPESIHPYFQSVTVYEYKVLDVIGGRYIPEKIRIAHWTMLDGRLLPIVSLSPGEVIELTCRPFGACPNVSTVHLSDTLGNLEQKELYFDTSDAALMPDVQDD